MSNAALRSNKTRAQTLTVKTAKMTIGVPIVTCLPRLYQQFTNGVPIVKNSQKQSKDSQNNKNDHWCTNRHMSTKTVATVYQSSKISRIHEAAQTPLPRETSNTCAWAVATARRPWAGLTICVYMDVHASGSRSLPRAATLSSTY